MKPEEVRQLKRAFGLRVKKRVNLPDAPTWLLGFDSEYTHQSDASFSPVVPICYQLHDGNTGHLMPLKGQQLKLSDLSATLFALAESRAPQARRIVLLSWFAQAEMSVLERDIPSTVIAHGNGLYGLSWHVEYPTKKGTRFIIYDVSAFLGNSDPGKFEGATSLRQAAQYCGLAKHEWDFEARPASHELLTDRAFVDYAINDAHLCYQIGMQLFDEFSLMWGVNPFNCRSVGQMSGVMYRYHYLPGEVHQPHPNVREAALLAVRGSGSHGGVWGRGVYRGQFAEFDAVSMYPSAAIAVGALPGRFDWAEHDTSKKTFEEKGIYRAQFEWPENFVHRSLMVYAPDPENKGRERWHYPRFGVDWFSGYELATAIKLGCKVRIAKGWYVTGGDDSFSTYMRHLTVLRDRHKGAGRKMHEKIYKNLANTLIGKLVQHRTQPHFSDHWDEEKQAAVMGVSQAKYQSFGGVFCPEWWVLITGYAKAVLSEVVARSGALHAQVDSVVIRETKPLPDTFTFKQIKFERKYSGDCLKVVSRNLWALFDGETLVKDAVQGATKERAVKQALRDWDGTRRIEVVYTQKRLVKLPMWASDPDRYPLMSQDVKRMRLILNTVPESVVSA